MTGDKVIRGTATAAAFLVAGIGAGTSCTCGYDLARDHGQDQVTAALLPVSTAGLVVAASLVLVHEARNRRAAPVLATVMLLAGIAAMAGADIAFGARYGPIGSVLFAWPAVACGGAADMIVQLAVRSRTAGLAPKKSLERVAVPDDVRAAVRAAYHASVQAGTPLSQKAMAITFGLSRRKIRQLIPECTTYIETRRRQGETV